MSSIKRILCPTDFSEGSKAALAYALNLGQRLHASVTLLHVSPMPMYIMSGGTYPPMADQSALMMESARRELDSWVEQYKKTTTVELDSALLQGSTYQQINAVAETSDTDLIVMGTHGRTGLAHVILGSVAERVVRTSKRRVITVPLVPAHQDADNALALTPTRILLAIDFSEPADRARELTKSLRDSLQVTVHAVHVVFRPYAEHSVFELESAAQHAAAYRLGLQTMLVDLKENFGPGPAVTTELLEGHPAEQILAAADRTGADLICAGTTGRGMLDRLLMGSVAQRLVRQSTVPVLTTR